MSLASDLRIAVLPGDGIGLEVMAACLPVVDAIVHRMNCPPLVWNTLPGGAGAYRDTGIAFSDKSMREVERADAILFGATVPRLPRSSTFGSRSTCTPGSAPSARFPVFRDRCAMRVPQRSTL